MRKYTKLLLVLFVVYSNLICGNGRVYAEDLYMSASEEAFIAEESAEVMDMNAIDEEADVDILPERVPVSENVYAESIPDNSFDTESDIEGLPEGELITEDAQEIDSTKEDSDHYEEKADDPIDDNMADIHQTDDEVLSGTSGYMLKIVWLDGGSKAFSLSDCGNLTEAKQKAGSLLQKLGLSNRCTLTVSGNSICAKVKNPEHISSKISVIAHMGFCKYAPENTLSSIQMAAAFGFSKVEFDIRFTKDGIPVLLHDETINNYGRAEDGTIIEDPIYVRDLTYKELQAYDFGVRRGQMWRGEKAPTLDSALETCAANGLRPYLDIKSDGRMTSEMICHIYTLIEKHNLQGGATYLSNIKWYLKTLAQMDPDSDYTLILFNIKEGYIEEAEGLKALINGKLYIYVHEWMITEAVERTCRFHNIPLNTAVQKIDQIAGLDKWVNAISVTGILPETVIKEAEKRKKNAVISYDGDVKADRNYCIYASRDCGFCAHIQSDSVGSQVIMWDGNGRKELNDFRFEPVYENLYRIVSTDSMLALSTKGTSKKVVLSLPSDEPEQLWLIQQNPNRTYTFINAYNGRSLHVNTGITQGDALIAAEQDHSSTEEFFLSLSLTEMPGGKVGDTRSYSDVQDPPHPFYRAVYWATWRGITKGFGDGSFGMEVPCTRGQAIMFLWRYAGKPAPEAVSKSPFKDVAKTHVFYKAILWASQNGITKGYPDGTFGIDHDVSRGELMMFLWRLKGKPAPKTSAKSPFRDVPTTHAFYKAILWGYQKKITNGYTSGNKKGTFGVDENCIRGAIVTFLYRSK